MTEKELKYAIGEGLMANNVHQFVTDETIREAGRVKDCRTVRKLAWRKYVESVKDVPALVKEADIPANYFD